MSSFNFQATLKAIINNAQGHILLIQESDGVWELPGGRMEHYEGFEQALKRECVEELGVAGIVIDDQPYLAWPALHSDGLWKIVLCFRMKLAEANLAQHWRYCNECIAYQYFDTKQAAPLQLSQQLAPLWPLLANKSNGTIE